MRETWGNMAKRQEGGGEKRRKIKRLKKLNWPQRDGSKRGLL